VLLSKKCFPFSNTLTCYGVSVFFMFIKASATRFTPNLLGVSILRQPKVCDKVTVDHLDTVPLVILIIIPLQPLLAYPISYHLQLSSSASLCSPLSVPFPHNSLNFDNIEYRPHKYFY